MRAPTCSNDPGLQLAFLTDDAMWLNIIYFAVAGSVTTVALVQDARGAAYVPGAPPGADGKQHVAPLHAALWRHAVRLQAVLLGIA
jgi:hypothetical protein